LQVDLPSDKVQLAYDLMHAEEPAASAIAHVGMTQDTSGSSMVAVLIASGNLLFYSVDESSGAVAKRAEEVDGVEGLVTISLCAQHLTGMCLLLLCCQPVA
jgi:hypothetical protein